jgi:hypothetical protein
MSDTTQLIYDVADLALADAGQQRVAWAARFMPVLAQVGRLGSHVQTGSSWPGTGGVVEASRSERGERARR